MMSATIRILSGLVVLASLVVVAPGCGSKKAEQLEAPPVTEDLKKAHDASQFRQKAEGDSKTKGQTPETK